MRGSVGAVASRLPAGRGLGSGHGVLRRAQWPDGCIHCHHSTPHLGSTRRSAVTAPIIVALDGAGDFVSLADAIAQAPGGATLHLGPGTHLLVRPLRITRSLSIVGQGINSTRVACAVAGTVVQFAGDGPFL